MGLVTGLAAAATVGGALLSSKSANKNAKRAAETSADNNAANVQLARDIYGQNKDTLNPFVQRGNAAGDQLNALLGLAPAQQATPAPQPNALAQFQGYPGGAGIPYGIGDGFIGGGSFLGNNAAYLDAFPQTSTSPNSFATGGNPYINPINAESTYPTGSAKPTFPQQVTGLPAATAVPTAAPTATDGGAVSPQDAAFQKFRDSTGYQFRLGEGLDAVTSAYAGIGGLQSGAAMRGINDYAAGMADNTFGQYAGLLSGQQAVGAGAASSLAGVGQNFAGTVIGANNFNAANQMNAQLGRQNGFANALGAIGGGILGFGG